jgi:hypothetical protein
MAAQKLLTQTFLIWEVGPPWEYIRDKEITHLLEAGRIYLGSDGIQRLGTYIGLCSPTIIEYLSHCRFWACLSNVTNPNSAEVVAANPTSQINGTYSTYTIGVEKWKGINCIFSESTVQYLYSSGVQ